MPEHYNDRELHKILVEQGHMPAFIPPKQRPPRDNEEQRNQGALIKWWDATCHEFHLDHRLLFAIPNGAGLFGPVTGAILKRTGLRAGAPDLFLARPKFGAFDTDRRHGLFIEMKTTKGVVSEEQTLYHNHLKNWGYEVAVCRSWKEARDAIIKYVK